MHTGWAMLVAVSGDKVLRRCRVELYPARGRFVYHEAAELELPEAAELVAAVRGIVLENAFTALGGAIQGLKVSGARIPTGSTVLPDDLAAILRSHPRIHAAEGALYAGAIAAACEQLEIPVITVRERDVWTRAAAGIGLPEVQLRSQVDAIRKSLGPPWTADHKIATAAAMIR
uniref:Uncharacterized protein n=1 Tax=Solibacter usitatus (strain Ellin6076) TaxID=234267 RepID=Q02D88_SOLUE